MVFNKDGKMIAAQWTAASGTWFEIGEVIDYMSPPFL
jgi:hypothetical protein